jgi:hypothetical protein
MLLLAVEKVSIFQIARKGCIAAASVCFNLYGEIVHFPEKFEKRNRVYQVAMKEALASKGYG